jgi:hypothetical protein
MSNIPMKRKRNNKGTARPRRASRTQREADLDSLIDTSPPAFGTLFIEEPKLLFAGNFASVDSKTGIEHYGPYRTATSPVRIGVIGTGRGIDAFKQYLDASKQRVSPGRNARGRFYDSLIFPDFPGANITSSFRTEFLTDVTLQRSIPEELFRKGVEPANVSTKLRQVTELVVKELAALADAEPEPNVVAVIMPPIVERECARVGATVRTTKVILTPGKKLTRRFEREREKTGQEFFPFDFRETLEEGQKGFWNIHHALKAHAMRFAIPTQLVWENRLRGVGVTQDPASVAWNFFTALYYKGGNVPWLPQHVPPNTCYVGVSFYQESPLKDAATQTSLAQVFSGSGEGMVLKGQRAVIDKKRDRKPHLDETGAEQLLRQAIDLYAQHHGAKPSRVVLHKSSRYWPEELVGFKEALGDIYRYDFLTLERLDTRFMRLGKEPPLRGTVITLAPRHHVIFCVGYIPYLGAYPGFRIPNPLEVVEHHGESPTELICQEIMALTKLNWNSCSFASSDPITVLFARTVGRILTELPPGVLPQTKYKFYM